MGLGHPGVHVEKVVYTTECEIGLCLLMNTVEDNGYVQDMSLCNFADDANS